MSKKCIVQHSGVISNICEAEDVFPIYEGENATLIWMDMPDDFIYNHDTSRVVNGEFVNVKFHETPFTLKIDRQVGYGEIAEQLDMQYRDKVNGTTEWKDHITAVKAANAKPSTGKDNYPHPAPREEPQWEKID